MNSDSSPAPFRFQFRVVLLCFSILFLFLLTACSNESTSTAGWVLAANLYSGRENPQRPLTTEEVTEFDTLLAELPVGTVNQRGGLGYQGFMLTRTGQAPADGIATVIVYDGIVEVQRGSGTYYLGDPDRALERWLFDTLQGTLSERERDIILGDLGVE